MKYIGSTILWGIIGLVFMNLLKVKALFSSVELLNMMKNLWIFSESENINHLWFFWL